MKFGTYLEEQMEPEWREWYLRYQEFKILLKEIVKLNEELASKNASPNANNGRVSSTPPKDLITMSFSFMETRPGNSGLKGERPLASEAAFFEAIDEDVKRVGSFVESTLARLKSRVEELDVEVNAAVREGLTFDACLPSTDSFESGSQSSEHSGASTDIEQASPSEGFPRLEATDRAAQLRDALHQVQREFLRVEKFANLNTTACYKILKKHDKLLPSTVCCRYYMERLHTKPWVTADHSATFVVQMSDLFEKLRPRPVNSGSKTQGNGPAGGDGAQNFVRTTRKYWVSTEDVSTVKQALAEHLPVFLMERQKARAEAGVALASADASADAVVSIGPGVTADSQMTSSVYLDNVSLGLYHTRLQKQPHSIAIRLRWYGSDPADRAGVVFVERKTHRESWTGDESVKERFALPPELVVPFLQGRHTWEMEARRLLGKNLASPEKRKSSRFLEELEGIQKLFTEVQSAVESKQLQPTLRTVYMRTAFQVPYDASVRCSLDTSLCMLSENPTGAPTCKAANRWFRNPEIPVRRTEVTRFPHAVLEIKLALDPGDDPPSWVEDLVSSGCLTEVHKFSKFMHGCAVLFPDIAQEVPYWVDDVSLRQSLQSVASRETGASYRARVRSKDAPANANVIANASVSENTLTHPLLVGAADQDTVLDLMGDARENAGMGDRFRRPNPDALFAGNARKLKKRLSAGARFLRRKFGLPGGGGFPYGTPSSHANGEESGRLPQPPRTVPMRIEPKTYFANERTFLAWLHTAVLIGTIGAGLVSVHMGNAAPRGRGAPEGNPGGSRAFDGGTGGDPSGRPNATADGTGTPGTYERVLTVVHRHEYVVVASPRGAGAGAISLERSSDGDRASADDTAAIEEIVSRAIAGYFENAHSNGGRGLGSVPRYGGVPAYGDAAPHALTSSPGHSLSSGEEGSYTSFGLTIALMMLSASVCLCAYATWTFIWRGRQISKRSAVPFHDPVGPVVMGCIMIATMSVFIGVTAANFANIAE